MELVPAYSDTSKVQSSHALSHSLPVVIAAADGWYSKFGGWNGRFDEAGTDWMRPNFNPDSLVANGGNLLSVLQSRYKVHRLSCNPANIICVQCLTIENNFA